MNKKELRKLLREKKEYYANQEKQAKEDYKARTGLKIARGFKDSSELNRVRRNEQKALRRIEKKQIQEKVKNEAGKGGIEFKETREYDANQGTFFWEVLTDSNGEGQVISQYREFVQAEGLTPGKNLFGIIVAYNGSERTYFSELGFVRGLSDLAKEASRLQQMETIKGPDGSTSRRTKRYPLVDMEIAEDIDGNTFITARGVF